MIPIDKYFLKGTHAICFISGGGQMPYSIKGYEDRAKECARLANLTEDLMIRGELLKLRQTYLNIAGRIRQQGFEETPRAN